MDPAGLCLCSNASKKKRRNDTVQVASESNAFPFYAANNINAAANDISIVCPSSYRTLARWANNKSLVLPPSLSLALYSPLRPFLCLYPVCLIPVFAERGGSGTSGTSGTSSNNSVTRFIMTAGVSRAMRLWRIVYQFRRGLP